MQLLAYIINTRLLTRKVQKLLATTKTKTNKQNQNKTKQKPLRVHSWKGDTPENNGNAWLCNLAKEKENQSVHSLNHCLWSQTKCGSKPGCVKLIRLLHWILISFHLN